MAQRLVAVFTPFEDLTDPRIERTRVHDLFELVVVALCGDNVLIVAHNLKGQSWRW